MRLLATTDATAMATAITNAGITNVSATVTTDNKVQIKHALGGDIKFVDTSGALTAAGFTVYVSATSGTLNLYHQPGTTAATLTGSDTCGSTTLHGTALPTSASTTRSATLCG